MFRRQQKGWIGIDIGTASVKVAQLARQDQGMRVLGQSIVARPTQIVTDNQELQPDLVWSAAGEVRAAVSLDSGFCGRQAAAVMPMGFCDVHQINQLAVDDDLDDVIRNAIETITQCSADHLEYDLWPTEPDASIGDATKWNILAVARPWADQIYRDVVEGGLMCRTIDGMPQVLARALTLSGADHTQSVGVLDWGFSQATFCVVVQGEPVYVRNLKDCSLERTLSAITNELGVTQYEAHQLLEKHGLRGMSANSSDETSSLIAELIAEPVRQLEQELAKTISHVGFQRRSTSPQEIYLFGGGALTAGLARHLARRLKLNTHAWSLKPESSMAGNHDCIFAPAMALSALAWEDS